MVGHPKRQAGAELKGSRASAPQHESLAQLQIVSIPTTPCWTDANLRTLFILPWIEAGLKKLC